MKRFVFLLVLIAGCSDALAVPSDSVRLEITAEYRQWWSELEACSGITKNIDKIAFYSRPEGWDTNVGAFIIKDGGKYQQIIVMPEYVHLEWLIKHEMMHALIQPGIEGHPRKYFDGACGNLQPFGNEKLT